MPYKIIACSLFLFFGWLAVSGFPFGADHPLPAAGISLLWGYISLGSLVMAGLHIAADFFDVPAGRLFMRSDGRPRRGWRSLVLLYMMMERGAWRGYRKRGREPLFSRVTESIYIGSHPAEEDLEILRELGIRAVLDVNCELTPAAYARQNPAVDYYCIPVLDGTAASQAQLEEGVAWARARLAEGKRILIHCTFGHGRSAAMTACVLVCTGIDQNLEQALNRLHALPRAIKLSKGQLRAVRRFLATMEKK